MTETGLLLPTPSKDTLVSHSDPEHGGGRPVDDIVISEQCAGHQQTGLAADGNFHSVESNITFNTTQENEASNTNADSKHPAPSTMAPSKNPNGGPSTPIVTKASGCNVVSQRS